MTSKRSATEALGSDYNNENEPSKRQRTGESTGEHMCSKCLIKQAMRTMKPCMHEFCPDCYHFDSKLIEAVKCPVCGKFVITVLPDQEHFSYQSYDELSFRDVSLSSSSSESSYLSSHWYDSEVESESEESVSVDDLADDMT